MSKLSNLSVDDNHFGLYPLRKEETFWHNLSDLRCLIRHQALQGELNCTPSDHQIMRPMKEKELIDGETNVKYVKNGQNPQMAYTQVHYLKGYFLLHHLSNIVGTNNFFAFLRDYIDLFHGRLVHSSDFLCFFFETFCHEPAFQDHSIQENADYICSTWLDNEAMPDSINRHCQTLSNELLSEIFNAEKKRSRNPKKIGLDIANFLPEQLILFLESTIAKIPKLKESTKNSLLRMKDHIEFRDRNADVQHRWCELILLCGWKCEFSFVEEFLIEHQAMGIYLYSELMLSDDPDCHQMAKNIFEQVNEELDASTRCNIQSILNG